MKVFEHIIEVRPGDTDGLGHVNNVRYLQWVQDVAEAHWVAVSSEMIRRQYVWVVLRHEIDYRGAAVPGDRLTVKTWVGESEGVKSVRYVEFLLMRTAKVIVSAKTVWCLLDGATRRPRKVEGVIRAFR